MAHNESDMAQPMLRVLAAPDFLFPIFTALLYLP